MGGIHRIKKSLNKNICMAKTGITFEGCEVMLIIGNPMEAEKKAGRFKAFLNHVVSRSCLVNMGDIMNASLMMRDRTLKGEPIWN